MYHNYNIKISKIFDNFYSFKILLIKMKKFVEIKVLWNYVEISCIPFLYVKTKINIESKIIIKKKIVVTT